MRKLASAASLILIAMSAPAIAAQSSIQLVIQLSADAERKVVTYECEGSTDPIEVEYINAHPNFLAITEVDGESLIFASAIAASGVRYVSGQFVWWTKGAEASLYDATQGEDAPALATCIEVNNIP